MTIDSARPTTPTESPARGIGRRQLMKAGAWAAPVLVMAVAAPAAAASDGTVPVAQLTAQAYALSNLNANGTPGPLQWAGGQIGWWTVPAGSPTLANVSYTVILTGPGGLSVPLVAAGVANITQNGAHVFPVANYGTQPMAGGTYTVTLTVFGSNGSTSAQSSVTLADPPPAPVVASYAVVPVLGNKHRVDLTLTGTPGTVVNIGINAWNVNWNPSFPASVTIPAGGTIVATGTANATGKTAGGLNITLSSSVAVNPNGFYNIPIPV